MAAKAVTITLGPMAERAEALLASGRYATMSELMREGLRALERQDAMFDAVLKAKVAEALADPRPSVPADEAFARIREAAKARRA